MTAYEKHLQLIEDTKLQLKSTNSWKRKNDLNKYLKRLESERRRYEKLRNQQDPLR